MLQNMMFHLLPESENHFQSHEVSEMKRMGLLRVATQDAIHQLSSQNTVRVDVDLGDDVKICRVVQREEFEEVNRKVFEKCESLIIQCLKDAKVEVQDLNDVIIVGGCSCIPRVKSLLASICGRKELYKGMNPLEAAVCGAAVEGAVASGINDPLGNLDLLTIQITPLAIGICADGNKFVPVIPKDIAMPTRKELVFTT